MRRFWAKVDKCEPDECWPWKNYINDGGYGKFRLNGKSEYAHRVAWEITNGPIPKGTLVCHKCDNTKCCNPDHLFLGSNLDNIHDAAVKGRLKKLNPMQTRVIYHLANASCLRLREIGEIFGVSQPTVYKIGRGDRSIFYA